MTKQLTEQEREAYAKIITAIDAVIKLMERTSQSLPVESKVRHDLIYHAFDIKNNTLDSIYNKLINWKGDNDE